MLTPAVPRCPKIEAWPCLKILGTPHGFSFATPCKQTQVAVEKLALACGIWDPPSKSCRGREVHFAPFRNHGFSTVFATYVHVITLNFIN